MPSIILKATEACNSNCIYCDVVSRRKGGSSMSLEMLDLVFGRIDEYLTSHPGETITLMWHGGEPLLLGAPYFHAAVDIQERRCPGTRSRIAHCIQTNLTLFSEDFVAPFRKLGITQVGTSYDPEPHVRGPGKQVDSHLYNRMFLRGTSVLERHGFGWGVIYVVTRRSLNDPLGVFFRLTNLKLDGGFNMNPVLVYGDDRRDIAISPGEYVEFLGAIFPVWWRNRRRFGRVEPFESLVSCIRDKAIRLGCVDSGSCALNHLNIAPDGETSQCGRSSDWGLLRYGNIADKPLGDLLQDEQRRQFLERNDILRNTECRGCRFWAICHGGCPLDAYAEHGDFAHKSMWCDAKRGFIERHFEPVTGIRY